MHCRWTTRVVRRALHWAPSLVGVVVVAVAVYVPVQECDQDQR